MSQNGSFVVRFLGAVLLIAILAGAGFMAFQAGQAQGFAQGAASISGGQPAASAPVPYYGHGGMPMHFFPFMGIFAIFPLMFGLCIIIGLFRLVIWGPRHYMHHGPWGYGRYMHHPWSDEDPCGEHEKGPQQPSSSEKSQPK
jgi:hypothetical protein